VDWSTLDRIAAVVIMPALLKMGWNLMANAMRALLDASLDLESWAGVSRWPNGW
jgi:divalent metal cation (Fe/Co/Zn/Cd) transporter